MRRLIANIGNGRNKGNVAGGEEEALPMRNLGKNIAWLLKTIAG